MTKVKSEQSNRDRDCHAHANGQVVAFYCTLSAATSICRLILERNSMKEWFFSDLYDLKYVCLR